MPISASRKLVEPFNRLKNRANLFRRKNYSSQLNISSHSADHRLSSGTDHRPSIQSPHHPGVLFLKRSNSMICPQQRLQTYLNQNNNNNNNHRNSICFELAGCSTDESSTDDYQLPRSAADHYWSKSICSGMDDIEEHETISSIGPSTIIEESTRNPISEHDEEGEGEKGKEREEQELFVHVNHSVPSWQK